MINHFYVVYSPEDDLIPSIHRFLEMVTSRKKIHQKLQFKSFDSEIEAQTFLFSKKIPYLKHKQNPSNTAKELKPEQEIEQPEKPQLIDLSTLISSSEGKQTFQEILKHQGQHYFKKSKIISQIKPQKLYIGFFDGCSKGNPGPSGSGYYLQDQQQNVVFQQGIYVGSDTNNAAQFYGLIHLLLDCIANNVKKLKVFGDSELVVKGVRGEYKIKKPNVVNKNILAKQLAKKFDSFEIEHVPRKYNERADYLANEGLKKKNLQKFSTQ